MNQKKNSKILIVCIIIVLLIVITLVAVYIMYFTDIFKSNKTLFFKYVAQITNTESGFIENDLKQYLEKKESTPYTNEGNITFNVNSSNIEDKMVESINNANITFLGNVDNSNSKSIQNISVNYSDNINFPIAYKKVQNNIGIQTQHIGSKYVSIDTANLNQLGIDENVNNISEINPNLTKEEIEHIKNTYMNVLNEQLQENNFSKIEESQTKSYKLTLNQEEQKNLIVKILETLKNDQKTIDILNKMIPTNMQQDINITTQQIDNVIKEYSNNENTENNPINIIVYQQNRETSKLEISDNNYKIAIEKMNNQNELQYNLSFETSKENQSINKANITLKYTGLQSQQNTNETYEINIEAEDYSCKYIITNNITFGQTENIEDFSQEDSLLLNDLEEEQLNNFVTAAANRINQVNNTQMEELGLSENNNPIITAITLPLQSILSNSLNRNAVTNEEEISAFNEKIELYKGTNIAGATVKGLLTTISLNNGLEEDEEENNTEQIQLSTGNELKIEEINFNGEEYEVNRQNITLIRGEVETESYYRVEFEKDPVTGAIYRAVVNKK